MAVLDWPVAAFRITAENWHLEGRTPRSQGLFGPGTVINTENRIWRVSVDLTALVEDEWRAVRALLDEARGAFGVVRVPVVQPSALDPRFSRAATFTGGVRFGRPFSPAELFAAGENGFWLSAGATPAPPGGPVTFGPATLDAVTVIADAPAGATRLRLSSPAAKVASMFSLPGDRLHRIARRDGAETVINPPLRASVAAGDLVEFAAPTARMRFDSDAAALVRGPANLTRATSLEMVEAL